MPNKVAAIPPEFTVDMAVFGGKDASEAFHMLIHKACSADVLFGYLAKVRVKLELELNEGNSTI